MTDVVIVDTGPLVALCNARDTFHDWTCVEFGLLSPPVVTSEAVLAESCYLLGNQQDAVLGLVADGMIRLAFDLAAELPSVRRLMRKYANVPMSLADGSLVRMSEIHDRSHILTLDSDFRIYRRHGRGIIPLIIPDVLA